MFCETQKILFFWRGEAGEKKEGNHGCQQVLFFKNWTNPGLFFVYFRSFQTNNTIFTTNECEKNVMSIQYPAPGF